MATLRPCASGYSSSAASKVAVALFRVQLGADTGETGFGDAEAGDIRDLVCGVFHARERGEVPKCGWWLHAV